MRKSYRTFQSWDREWIEDRYRELSGDGIAKSDQSALKIFEEMKGKYTLDSITNVIVVMRRTFPVPTAYRADVESGRLQRAKDGEHCPHCSMALYYRMQKDGIHIHSWLCPWCHTEEYIMTCRVKTNKRPVGEQDYRNLIDQEDYVKMVG